MNIKTFYLNNEKTVLMRAYMLSAIDGVSFCEKRPAILILPGGGYEFTSEREAEPIAMHYLSEGYNAFVLYYTCNQRFPASFYDAAYALYKIRLRADEFGIDRNKIAVWGASAGGHLAGCLATMWNDVNVLERLGCEGYDIRPDAAILCYPVISGITNPHKGSFEVLLGKDAPHSELSRLSLENRVTPKTPPTFIWCTANDESVPAHNSLVMAKALVSNKVPVELHMFDVGPHGMSTCDKVTAKNEYFCQEACKAWIDLSIKFLARYMNV